MVDEYRSNSGVFRVKNRTPERCEQLWSRRE